MFTQICPNGDSSTSYFTESCSMRALHATTMTDMIRKMDEFFCSTFVDTSNSSPSHLNLLFAILNNYIARDMLSSFNFLLLNLGTLHGISRSNTSVTPTDVVGRLTNVFKLQCLEAHGPTPPPSPFPPWSTHSPPKMCTITMTLHTICTHHTRRRELCVFASGPWIETITVPEAPKDIVACFRTPGACNWDLKIVDRIEFGYCSLCKGKLAGRNVKNNFCLTYEERQWEGTQETEAVGNVWDCLGGGRRGWM